MNTPAMGSSPDRWYCRVNRERLGPMTFAQLQELARTGRLRPTDWVQQDNADKGKLAHSVPGLFATAPVTVGAAANLPAPAVPPVTSPRPAAPASAKTSPTNPPPSVTPAGWYFVHNDKKHGPFTFERLKCFAGTGELRPTDMVLAEGTNKWVQASSIAGLFVSQADATASAPIASVHRPRPAPPLATPAAKGPPTGPLPPLPSQKGPVPPPPPSDPPRMADGLPRLFGEGTDAPCPASQNATPGLGRRLLHEGKEVCTASVSQTVRLLSYTKGLWRNRGLNRSAEESAEKLGNEARNRYRRRRRSTADHRSR